MASITSGARGDERKKRDLLGGIMLIGGSSKIPGLNLLLEEKLRELNQGFGKDILIGTMPKDLDGEVVVWKGASVFGRLSTSGNDSWVSRGEWDTLGERLLIHKCMFPW